MPSERSRPTISLTDDNMQTKLSIPEMRMNSDILKDPNTETKGIGLNLLTSTAMGVWKTEPSCPAKQGSHAESCTPQLLSSSNSVACSLSPGPKKKRIKKRLFGRHLTLRDLGVDEVALKNSDRGYTLTYPQIVKKRWASQDVLTLNLPAFATTKNKTEALQPLNKSRIHPSRSKPSVHFTSSTPPTLSQLKKARKDRPLKRHRTAKYKVAPEPNEKRGQSVECIEMNTRMYLSRSKSSVHLTSSTPPTLSQLKKALKSKLDKARQARPLKRHRTAKYSAPEPNEKRGQSVECIEMNTGTLYLYKGGDLPRKVVFIRRL